MSKRLIITPEDLRLPVARVLDASDKDLYQEVKQKTAEKFGRDSQAYKTVMNGIDPKNGTGSQFFFNTEVGLYLPEGQRVASLNDWDAIWSQDPSFLRGNYTDLPALVLRSEQATYEANAPIIQNLAKQAKDRNLTFSPENPLMICNASLVGDERSKNSYGILVKLSDNPEDTSNDPRFSHKKDSIELGDGSKRLYTKQNGLSRVYLNGYGSVYSGYDSLQDSDDIGRVVVFDAEGVALRDFIAQEVTPFQEKIAGIKEILGKA